MTLSASSGVVRMEPSIISSFFTRQIHLKAEFSSSQQVCHVTRGYTLTNPSEVEIFIEVKNALSTSTPSILYVLRTRMLWAYPWGKWFSIKAVFGKYWLSHVLYGLLYVSKQNECQCAYLNHHKVGNWRRGLISHYPSNSPQKYCCICLFCSLATIEPGGS